MLFHDPKGTDPILVDGYDSYEITIAETIALPIYDFKEVLRHAVPSQLKEVLARLCVTADQDKTRVDYTYNILWEITKPTPSSYRVGPNGTKYDIVW